METMFFHPKLVHLPMALAVLMPFFSATLLLTWWRRALPIRAFALAVALQGVLIASGVAALRSGEADGERVEQVVAEGLVEAHEEAAEAFVVGAGVVFGAFLLGLLLSKTRAGLPIAALGVAGSLVVFLLGWRTGEAGGALVYQHGAAAAFVDRAAPGIDQRAKPVVVDDDDD